MGRGVETGQHTGVDLVALRQVEERGWCGWCVGWHRQLRRREGALGAKLTVERLEVLGARLSVDLDVVVASDGTLRLRREARSLRGQVIAHGFQFTLARVTLLHIIRVVHPDSSARRVRLIGRRAR